MNVPLSLVLKPAAPVEDLQCFMSQKRYDLCMIAGKNPPQVCDKLYQSLLKCREAVKQSQQK